MFFKIFNDENGYTRVQVALGGIRRSFTVRQFMVRVTDILNRLGYEVKEKSDCNDAVEFLKAYTKMCNSYYFCERCPITQKGLSCAIDDLNGNEEYVFKVVDRWARENKN